MTHARLTIPTERLAEFSRRHHIRRLAQFGSALRDDFHPDSDVNVLIEFEPGRVPELAFFAMPDELAEIFRRQVDLNTPGFLSSYFRDKVMADAEALYESQ